MYKKWTDDSICDNIAFLGERKGIGCSQYLQYESYETTP